MALSLMPLIKPQFFDDNGLPLSGGSVACFDPGTSDYKTIYTSDEHDDLGDMMKIAPLVDAKGEPVRDAKTGNQIIDDSTLPEYLCTKVDGQVHWRGDRTHGPNAAFHGWLLGGIRQLYSMVNSSFAQVNSSYAALDTRIRDLETRRI